MRSPHELAFRLRQEAVNLLLFARPPRAASNLDAPLAGLPKPCGVEKRLRGSAFAGQVERLAADVLRHRFPLLGGKVETGPVIEWRRDYAHGRASGTEYFRRVPYLDFARVGDHKTIWELNRHQHLVLLAQAWVLHGRVEYLGEIEREVRSWWEANPYARGMNWASALEVAFRALSWTWIHHLAGAALPPDFSRLLLGSLYAHGRYLEENLSVYFSPNTHLLGEAVALQALGTLFPSFPRAAKWRRTGWEIVQQEMERQVRGDGTHFEQSSYYHMYAVDMFLFSALLGEMRAAYRVRLARMADYLDALMGALRRLPLLGDDDGGRFFHPYGERDCFGRATLATAAIVLEGPWNCRAEDLHEQAAWWRGGILPSRNGTQDERSRLFADAGVAVMRAGETHVVVDAGPFGFGGAGHSHSDTLSLIVNRGEEELLVDAGTFTYVADPQRRDWFRGSAAHNTVRIDGRDQAEAAGPFRWTGKPAVNVLEWRAAGDCDYLDAACSYAGFRHRRRVLFRKPHWLFVLDEIDGPPGEHLVEQFWHAAETDAACGPYCFRLGRGARLLLSEAGEMRESWRSRALGEISSAPAIAVAVRKPLPVLLAAVVDLSTAERGGRVEAARREGEVIVGIAGETAGMARFRDGAGSL